MAEVLKIRQLKDWSKAVKDRDGKCMECGKAEDLHAHHIKPKSTHPELKLDVENGVTLCYGCHKRRHEAERIGRGRQRGEHPRRSTMRKKLISMTDELLVLREYVRKLERKNRELRLRIDEKLMSEKRIKNGRLPYLEKFRQ